MRGQRLLLARCHRWRNCHDAVRTNKAGLSASANQLTAHAPASRKFLATSYGPRLAPQQQPKTFTRYALPKSIQIERASDMTASQTKPTLTPRTAYVALGSNLGDRIAHIEEACREMDQRGIRVKRTSSLWETEPMYYAHQDRFVNGACEVNSSPSLFFLLVVVRAQSTYTGQGYNHVRASRVTRPASGH